jgi:inner membrane protein
MDNLTHGLLGLAVGALRRPDSTARSGTDGATLLACVLAAELPDLDTLLPADNSALHDLQAHRGLSHSLLMALVVALVATLLARLVFRGARPVAVFPYALVSVLLAHLLPDLWTGWGTRLLLPFSDLRLALDWTLVVDPFVTLPLLAGAVWAWRGRHSGAWRRALLTGLCVSAAYVGARVAVKAHLEQVVRTAYPKAERTRVFPTWLGITRWRYVAQDSSLYAAGDVGPLRAPREQRRVPVPPPDALPAEVRAVPTVGEALAWARFPLVSSAPMSDGALEVRVADLRYHLEGKPTLTFVVALEPVGDGYRVRSARLERGGSASELLRRWRGQDAR